jgi:hypothetical protein
MGQKIWLGWRRGNAYLILTGKHLGKYPPRRQRKDERWKDNIKMHLIVTGCEDKGIIAGCRWLRIVPTGRVYVLSFHFQLARLQLFRFHW